MTNSSVETLECSRDSCVYRVYERSGKCSWHDLAYWDWVFQEKIQECWTQISTMEPEDKKVVDRQHPFLSSSMGLIRNPFPEFWTMGLLTGLMKETSMCRQMLMWASELDWNLRWSCDSTLKVPKKLISHHEIGKTLRSLLCFCTEILPCFIHIFWTVYFFALLRLQLFLCLQLRARTKRYPVPGEDWRALYEAFTLLEFDEWISKLAMFERSYLYQAAMRLQSHTSKFKGSRFESELPKFPWKVKNNNQPTNQPTNLEIAPTKIG